MKESSVATTTAAAAGLQVTLIALFPCGSTSITEYLPEADPKDSPDHKQLISQTSVDETAAPTLTKSISIDCALLSFQLTARRP